MVRRRVEVDFKELKLDDWIAQGHLVDEGLVAARAREGDNPVSERCLELSRKTPEAIVMDPAPRTRTDELAIAVVGWGLVHSALGRTFFEATHSESWIDYLLDEMRKKKGHPGSEPETEQD